LSDSDFFSFFSGSAGCPCSSVMRIHTFPDTIIPF
jgi:hypothetical protein